MIISALVKLIKTAIDGFSACCAFLLVKLRLWISAVFALCFIIVCAFSGIPLEGKVISYFLGGVVSCFALGLLLSFLAYYKDNQSQKQSGGAPLARVKKRDEDDNFCISVPHLPYEETPARETQSSVKEQTPAGEERQYNYTSYKDNQPSDEPPLRDRNRQKPSEKMYEDFSQLKKKYIEQEQTSRNESVLNSEQTSRNESVLNSEQPQPVRVVKTPVVGEKPMIFAMRKDPSIIVYEFSDRLEFYKKMRDGSLRGERVEFKS